jgi:O-acetyl-ADP-ribose deacetylase (regulator of RNase III)
MSLQHAQGNLLTMAEQGQFDVVVQGCNCWNTMGRGIAREIRQRYPIVAAVDAQTMKGDYTKLGNWTVGRATDNFLIINAYTQYNMGTDEDVFEYTAFQLILQKLVKLYGDKRIGLPYIGMGLAGGDKETIMTMIEWFAEQVIVAGGSVTLVEFA